MDIEGYIAVAIERMASRRVATTFVAHNLNVDSQLIRRNIWSLIDHYENPQTVGFTGRVIDDESKIINSTSAMLVFDVSEEQAQTGIATCTINFDLQKM